MVEKKKSTAAPKTAAKKAPVKPRAAPKKAASAHTPHADPEVTSAFVHEVQQHAEKFASEVLNNFGRFWQGFGDSLGKWGVKEGSVIEQKGAAVREEFKKKIGPYVEMWHAYEDKIPQPIAEKVGRVLKKSGLTKDSKKKSAKGK